MLPITPTFFLSAGFQLLPENIKLINVLKGAIIHWMKKEDKIWEIIQWVGSLKRFNSGIKWDEMSICPMRLPCAFKSSPTAVPDIEAGIPLKKFSWESKQKEIMVVFDWPYSGIKINGIKCRNHLFWHSLHCNI